jgi:uncharacterized protein YjbJ (UPF0337 family)
MNWDRIEGQWRQLTGQVKSAVGKATDDDVMNVAGKGRTLIGVLQSRYGVLKDDIDKAINGFTGKPPSSDQAKTESARKADQSS